MTVQPEDFAGEAEVDDSTRLASRRQPPVAESEDSTQLATRRSRRAAREQEIDDSAQLATRRTAAASDPTTEPEPDDSTRLATRRPVVEPDDSTQLATRRHSGPEASLEDDSTRLSVRDTATIPPPAESVQTQLANPNAAHPHRTMPDLPPGAAPLGMHVRPGGFGASTEAYRPRDTPSSEYTIPPLPPTPASNEYRDPVLTPVDAQRKRESAHRASVTKVVAIGVAVLVIGSAAVIGIVLLVRGLL
ncbi:hypothetical protein [Demequina aurantiaca]|uniref:hypothetical protein n=1 Tax=Demequina aurantiaca TaxID=676200 RepID=UPI000785E34A|nr:hypothetical protein [Demequina aurantiaca]